MSAHWPVNRPLFANDVFRFSSTELLYHRRVFSSQSNLLWYSILGRGFVLLPSRLSEKNGNMPMDEHSGGAHACWAVEARRPGFRSTPC